MSVECRHQQAAKGNKETGPIQLIQLVAGISGQPHVLHFSCPALPAGAIPHCHRFSPSRLLAPYSWLLAAVTPTQSQDRNLRIPLFPYSFTPPSCAGLPLLQDGPPILLLLTISFSSSKELRLALALALVPRIDWKRILQQADNLRRATRAAHSGPKSSWLLTVHTLD